MTHDGGSRRSTDRVATDAPEAILVAEEDVRDLRAVLASARARRDGDALDLLAMSLERACVVPRSKLPPDIVAMNSTVEFQTTAGRRQIVRLVFPSQADFGKGRVSVFAPVGVALLGLRVGQCLDWPVPRGVIRVQILRVSQATESGPPCLSR